MHSREKHTRVQVIQHPADAESSGEEDDKEPDEPEIEDSQILEDLPNETEVRMLLLTVVCWISPCT